MATSLKGRRGFGESGEEGKERVGELGATKNRKRTKLEETGAHVVVTCTST